MTMSMELYCKESLRLATAHLKLIHGNSEILYVICCAIPYMLRRIWVPPGE